jgi:uroporphyrinogen-III synthase
VNDLLGRRIVNSRAMHQAGELDAVLRARGAEPIAYPCIAVAPPVDRAPVRVALDRLAFTHYRWLMLTSVNAVDALVGSGMKPGRVRAKVAAVGPPTAAAAERAGLRIAFIPDRQDATELANTLPVEPGDRVLYPVSALAPDKAAAILETRGAVVDVVHAYDIVVGSGGDDLPRLLLADEVDALTFASSSAVDGLLTRLAAEGADLTLLRGIPKVCIGKQTALTATERGLDTVHVSPRASLDGLADELARVLAPAPREISHVDQR